MSKKRRYIPGWQLKQKSEDREIREKAALALDKYYERQNIVNQIQEAQEQQQKLEKKAEEIKKVSEAQENDTTNSNDILDTAQTATPDTSSFIKQNIQQPVAKMQSVTGQYGKAYNTESAADYLKRTQDLTAFSDQFIRTPLDPDYEDWASRQAIRAAENPIFRNTLSSKAATAAMKLQESFLEDSMAGKESVPERMKRRVWEHSMFSTVDQKKELTPSEQAEIVQFRAFNDPLWGAKYINDMSKVIKQNEAEDEKQANSVERPDDYTGSIKGSRFLSGGNAILGVQSKIASLAESLWAKSFLSDFILKTNDSQMKTSIGQIQRSKEFVDLSSGVMQNVDLIEQLANNIRSLRRLDEEAGQAGIKSLSPEKRDIYSKLLDQNREIRNQLDSKDWWKDANNLASWAPTKMGYVAGVVDKVIDDDIGGVRNNLYGLDDKLDELKTFLQQNNQNDEWLNGVTNVTGKIKQQLNQFNAGVAEKQERWKDQALTDLQDIVDWKTGNNWMGMKAKVDPYYKAQETLLEKSGFKWNDPVKMAQFGWSGVAGGSNSSWWKSIISIGSKGFGAIAGAMTTGGTSAAIQLGSIAASFEADKSAGSDENNIESEDRTATSLRNKLQASGKYNDFLREGIEQLGMKDVIKQKTKRSYTAEDGTLVRMYGDDDTNYRSDVLKKALKLSDSEELQQQVLDLFLAGMWHSADPEITRMHADAVIGTNNQFYNNQPVNTTDAAIGSIVDIANLNVVKYLANSAKIMRAEQAARFGKKFPKAALKYQGFKEGIHNLGVKAAESKIAKAIENTPIGIVVGSTLGTGIGSDVTDGSITGGIIGGVAGAALGGTASRYLGKGLKYIGVEDKIAREYQKARAFATSVPSAWLKAASVAKTAANIGTRMGLDTASEMLQEGVQGLNAREGEQYDVQYNRPLALRIFDDMMLGARSAYIWANQNDPEMQGEADVWSQMNATPLLTLLGPGTLQVGVQIRKGMRDYDMIQAIQNNIDAERRANVAELEQGRSYAKHITPERKEVMLKKFGQFKKIAGAHKDAKEKLGDALMNEDEHYIPQELIDEQIKDYEDIYELANSKYMRNFGKSINARPGSDRYAQLVSAENFLSKRRAQKAEDLHEIDVRNANNLGEDALPDVQAAYNMQQAFSEESFGEELPTGETISAEEQTKQRDRNITWINTPSKLVSAYNRAKMLMQALALYRIVQDYSTLKDITNRDNTFLDRSKARFNDIKKQLQVAGVDIENEDDIMQALNMSDEGVALREIMSRANIDMDESVSWSNMLSAYADMLRDRELAEYDFILADQQLKSFHRDPEFFLHAWKKRRTADRVLEGILEEEYVNTIRGIEKAASREVRDNDIYLGRDGKTWYKVKYQGGDYVKFKYDPLKRKNNVSKIPLPFDPVEYDEYWTYVENNIAEREKANKATENIQTGEVKQKEQTAKSVVQHEEKKPAVQPEPEPEVEDKLPTFSPGQYVEMTNPETGDVTVGIVREMSPDNKSVEVETPNGEPVVVPNDTNILTVLNSPISVRKYPSGTILTDKRGKKYTVASSRLTSINESTMEGQYQYDVIDLDTDAEMKMTEQEIEDLLNAEPEKEESFEETKEQKDVRDAIASKVERDEKALGGRKPTAHDYFIKVKNKIQRFLRVHSILDPLFDEDRNIKEDRLQLEQQLRQLYDEDKKEYTKKVEQLQEEYNKQLLDKFGESSYEYKFYKIDLSLYLSGPRLYDEENPAIISTIITNVVTNPALVVGTHIDKIARLFFDGKNPQNEPQYCMSDEVFKSVIDQLKNLDQRFKQLKWSVYTEELTWYGQMSNGTRFAGTTDLIAVDQQGRIHVLDFKTTSNATRFDIKYQKRGVIRDIDGTIIDDHGWITVADKSEIQPEDEWRITSSFLEETATKDHGQTIGNRTYAAQYARQLAAYRYLIQQELGAVASLEIIPFYVGYKTDTNGRLTSIYEVYMYDPVNLSDVEEIKQELQDVDDFLNDKSWDWNESLQAAKNAVNERIQYIKALISDSHLSDELRQKLNDHITGLLWELGQYEKAVNDKTKTTDSVFMQQLSDNVETEFQKARITIEQANKQISDAEAAEEAERNKNKGKGSESESGPVAAGTGSGGRSWLFDPLEKVVDSARRFWNQFNNLHSWSDFVVYMPGYMQAIIQRDFVTNSKFVITRDDKNNFDLFKVTITYRGHTFDPITIRLGNDAELDEDKNKDIQADDSLYSLMGRNFLKQFYQLRNVMKPGDTIVATKIERTNGKLVYGEDIAKDALNYSLGLRDNFIKYIEHRNLPKSIIDKVKACSTVEEMVSVLSQETNLQDTAFFDQDDPRYGHMLDGERSIIGVVDERGNIVEITTGTRMPLLSPSEDLDGNLKNPKVRQYVKPGNNTETIPAGVVMFLYRFKNEEDPETQPERIIPIALKGMKLGEKKNGTVEPSKVAKYVVALLKSMASGKKPHSELEVQAINKDGSKKFVKISGYDYLKALNIITRFGQQAWYAGHEFVFDFARDESSAERELLYGHTVITITDMRAEPREVNGILHRDTINLNLGDEADIQALYEILSELEMHINQFGEAKFKLNTPEAKGPFGDVAGFFAQDENKDVQSVEIIPGITIDREDVEKGLSGIEWAIKHGVAKTNALSVTNPLISIHELDIDGRKPKLPEEKPKPVIGTSGSEDNGLGEENNLGKDNDVEEQPAQTDTGESSEPEQKGGKPAPEVTDEEIRRAKSRRRRGADYGTLAVSEEELRPMPMTTKERNKAERNLRRLVGKLPVRWSPNAIKVLQSGAKVAGRAALAGFELYDRIPKGGEYHEAFHRIFEILMPNSIRKSLYEEYRTKYNESFKQEYGRDLTDKDISENFAELFRHFMIDRDPIKIHLNLLKTFKEIRDFIQGLRNLGSRRFAMLFLAANSGIFRFMRPDEENVKHFMTALDGEADMTISARVGKERKTIKLNEFPPVGGKDLLNDAVDSIIYALCTNYSIDYLARNASRLKTNLSSIQMLYKGEEKTTHSSWFRVITGEYANEGDQMTVDDAFTYWDMYEFSDQMKNITRRALEGMPKEDRTDDDKVEYAILREILKTEGSLTREQLDPRQRMLGEVFSEKVWPFIEQKVNNKLHKMGLDSELVSYDEYIKLFEDQDGEEDDTGQPNQVGKDASDHKDEFFDHSRTEDATAAIRFFLSSIPDEHFATQDDVDAGIVDYTTREVVDKDGTVREEPVLVKNNSSLFGFKVFLSMKAVSQKLLSVCNNVRNAEQLDELLQDLASDDPVFYRIAKKYHAAKQNEIVKTKDGKNAIMYDGLTVDQSDYFQHKDENGYYYTWAKNGEDTGVRMVGAVTQTDPDMESFVTQLFNYVACQRLDFIRVKFSQRLDEEGEPLDGQYISEVRKTSDDYASRIFPIQWFERLRGGFSGIFRMTTGGKYTFTEDGKKKLDHAISTINTIYKIVRENKKIKLDGVQYDKARQDDFLKIENAYISALNDLGIDITREAFEFGLRERFGRKEPLSIQMGKFFGLADPNGVSYKKFTEMIERLQKNATESGKNEILSLSQRADDSGRGRFDKGQEASGTNLYSDNSVVKWFAKSVSAYNKSTKELMTNGPENTKRYLMAQSHTISDMTVDINDATSDGSGNIKNSRILKDMQKYLYNFLERGKNWDLPIGSLIIKHVLQSGGIHLTLHTHGGIMVDEDLSGGVSYKKITEREDWLAKAAILKQGGIIFPTLSDKSTWFYVTGVTIPGINYYNIESMSKNSLPELGLHEGEDLSSDAAHIIFDWNRPNAQIDQMIEYAECEMAAIEREINRKTKLPIIEYFNENRKRFGGLTEIVKINEETGEPDVVLFNDYDMTPEECLALAKREFFDLPIAEQRKRMALTLETGFWENVRTLEHAGVIVADGKLRQQKLDKDGNPTGETVLQNRLLQYSNVGLDSEVIKELTAKYMESVDENDKDGYADNLHRAEAKAIVAHIWDIYMRGVISNEEVERIYIGQPQFFKWVSGKIKDALSGKTMHCLIDRFSDQSKRLGGAGSTGEKNRLDLVNTRRTYVCAEIEDVKVKSALYDDFKRIVKISSIKQAYLDWKTQQIKNETENYEELQAKLNKLNDDVYKNQTSDKEEQDRQLEAIRQEMEAGGVGVAYDVAVKNAEDVADTLGLTKPADGAAFISPECAKTLLRMRGKFTSEVKKAFEYLEGEDSKSNVLRSADAYKIVTEAIIGTQKYSAYGYRINAATDEIPVHYYNKFALFPLFKFMATGFTADLYRKMQEGDEQGRPIDMVMMHSGVKTGSEQPGMFDPSKLRIDDNDDNEQNWEHDKETGKRTKLKPTVEDFQFHTYEQDYSFIRRQLNTDPHEKNNATMGTQMTKVALSNIKPNMEYTLQDGTPVRGRELLDRIMGSINALSDLGKEKIKSQLLNEDGTIDIDKFSEFLEEELDQRDADANLIDGIEVVEEEEVDKVTGEVRTVRRFNVELEAMSSVDWIQSIIVSKINKEVCDINVKGNAFYQRPAWGVEGKPLILDDATVDFAKRGINNGEKLNVINNDGSMDAVISLDFFYDILPEGIRDNFEKSREWLFKHKIIGNTPDVHANCINARIPTQAQSSIGALRFVDVIPVVRDTIILPQEITGIDGSDFDIDKRYLVRLSYNVTYGKDRNTEDIVSTIFDEKENPEDFYRNKLINDYLVLLKSHGILTDHGLDWADSSHTSLSAIDKDTKLVTDVRDKINKNKPKKRYYAFQFGNIAFQVITKLKFMVGKFGIGPFALNNNNQILTQLYNVVFAKAPDYTNILDALGCLSLANEADKQGHRILSWLSGLINVHVDIAKNPDSIDGLNINTYTYNLVNLLIRTGMGERGLFLTAQPVMTELSRVYDDASGSFMTDPNKSKSAKQRDAINDFLYDNFASRGGRNIKEQRQRVDKFMLNERINTQEEQKQYEEIIGSYAKALFGIDNNGKYIEGFKYITPDGRIITKPEGCILEDVLTNTEVLKDVRNGATFDNLDDREAYVVFVKDESGNTVEMRWSAKQVQEAVAYVQNNLNIYARHLSDLVNACKIDTKKHGKNYVEQQAYLDKYNQVFENKDGIFEQAGLDDLRKNSYVDTKTHNAIDLYELILKQFSIQATKSFKKVHNKVIERLNSSVQNKVLSSKITKAIMTHIKLDFFSKYCEQRGENYYQDLLYGDNTVQYKLLHLQNSIRNDKTGKYRKYGSAGIITNPLLKALQADVYENRNGFDNPKLIIMQDALLDDKDTANALERAWDELFNDYEHYTEDAEGNKTYYVREFAIDLAVYAFMTSGDVGGKSKFFKFVPNTIRKYLSANINGEEMSYNTYIRRTRENWQNELSDEEADAIAKEVIYENWTDNDFVRPVRLYTSKITTDRETGRKRKVKSFQLTTKMYYTDKSTQNVRKYSKRYKKYYFVAQTIEKKILSIVAGAKKVGKELIETIYRNGDNYPLYIKVRRQSSDYRDNDNMILYEYQGQNELDPENPQNGTYPVYRIVLPKVAKFRAGTYQYNLYGINDGQRSCVYPISVLEALELMQHESPISESKDKTQLLKDIQNSFNKMAIWMADDELEDFLIKEYQMNGMDDTSNIQKDLETLKTGLDTNKSISERQKQEDKKSKKVEIRYESDGSVDIWWGSDPKERKNGILSNLAPRKVKFNGITYPSVEAAWQAQKLSYSNMPAKEKKLVLLSLQASDGLVARNIGSDPKVIKNLNTEKWDSVKDGLMHDIIKASLEQNKDVMKLLLSTKDAKLTHLKASLRSEWRTKFPKILSDVRSELAKQYKKDTSENQLNGGQILESSGDYPQRTKENAQWSDITLDLTETNKGSGGANELTKRVAGNKYVHFQLHDSGETSSDPDAIFASIKEAGLPTTDIKLNIAGSEIGRLKHTQEEYNNEVERLIKGLLDLGVTISEIRSGGQTGIDEAGIIAAQKLGIKWSVNAPNGFKFRTEDGTDISDKDKFISRFGITKKQKPQAKPATIIDISKDEEFKKLSNTANRSITINGNEFPTVMHAYNYAIVSAAKVDAETRAKYQQAILSATSMRDIQNAVSEVVDIAGEKPLSQDVLDSLLYKLMYMSFDQNPEAVGILLNTENAEFKGVSDKVAENLKKIRDKFKQDEENATNDNEFDDAAEKACNNK